MIEPLRDTVVNEGVPGNKLTCVISGQPTPSVKWFHNEKPIKGGKSLSDGLQVLELPAAQVKGVYTVQATNKHGTAETTATVNVQG